MSPCDMMDARYGEAKTLDQMAKRDPSGTPSCRQSQCVMRHGAEKCASFAYESQCDEVFPKPSIASGSRCVSSNEGVRKFRSYVD